MIMLQRAHEFLFAPPECTLTNQSKFAIDVLTIIRINAKKEERKEKKKMKEMKEEKESYRLLEFSS